MLVSTFDSSIAADEVFAKITQLHGQERVDEGEDIEKFAEVDIDPNTGALRNADGIPVHVISEDCGTDSQAQLSAKPLGRGARIKFPNCKLTCVASRVYSAFVTSLCRVGIALQPDQQHPDVSSIMVNAAVSHDEFMRRNPKWSKASTGLEKAMWLEADLRERAQQFDPTHCTLQEVPDGMKGVPFGTPVWPLKRHCKIKDDGIYKVRWVVLGNLDDFEGSTYSPTPGKKVVWLIFALSILLGLFRRFFDVKGAFMAERPNREVYVSLDGVIYLLLYNLYGLKDAAKVFNDGLVEHLRKGGYTQSVWDECLWYKWISIWNFIYLLFHVDDFKACGTSEDIINDFQCHLESKYQVTSNTNGVYLGIHMTPLADSSGSYCFTKPTQLQHLFDTYLTNGPTMTIPTFPMSESYIKNFDVDDSPLCDTKTFRSFHGALMQLVDCRPDIAFPIAKISQRQGSPRDKDLQALSYLLHYLYGTRDRGLILRRGDRESARTIVKLRGYSDMSLACHSNGKSHYCICFDLIDDVQESSFVNPLKKVYNTGMFYFKSLMAPTVDLNACEGEVGAMVELTKDAIFFNGILDELHQKQVKPTPLYNDNDASIMLATQYSGRHKRVRYMLPRINWLMEQTKSLAVKMLRMGTDDLPADVGTKAGRGPQWRAKVDRVMGNY